MPCTVCSPPSPRPVAACALGMDASLISLAALVGGLLILVSAVRALLRRAFISGVLLLLLGLWLLSLFIH